MKIFDLGEGDEGMRKKEKRDEVYILDFYREYYTYLESKKNKINVDFNKAYIVDPEGAPKRVKEEEKKKI